MAHVAVDVWEDGVAAPGGHEEAEGEGDCAPVGGEEVLFCGFAEGTGLVGFDEAVCKDAYNDWGVLVS